MAQRPSRAASKQQLVVPKVPPVTLPSSSGRKWRHAAVVIGLWCATFAAYSNSFRAALSFDSVVLVARDTRVHATTARNVRLIWGGEYWHKIGATGLYRPLTTFSFLFNYAVLGGGTDAAGYHWLNFGLHGVNILLVYLLAFTVLGEVPIAAVVAGLWALHPVSVEAVTNIAGRADLLAAVGVLLGLLCHVRAADAPSLVRRLAWLALLILAAAIGIFSKENAITLPAAMLAFDVALRLGRDAPAQRWRTLLPGYLAVAVPLVFYVAVRAQVLSPILAVTDFLDNPLVGAGFRTSRLTAIAILGKYLGLLVWPARLSADYSYHQIPLFSWSLGSWTFWSAALSVAVWSAILLIAMRSYRSRPSVFFFIAFFAVTMAPTSNLAIRIGSSMAERFLYLPSVGFAGCLAIGIWSAGRRVTGGEHLVRFAAPALAGAICILFAVRVYARNRDWQDELTLWTHDTTASPNSYKTHASLAELLWREGPASLDGAIAERQRAISIIQDLPAADQDSQQWIALAICYREKGEPFPSGGVWYQRSLEALRQAESVARAQEETTARANRSHKRPPPSGLPVVYLQRGRTYRSMGESVVALDSFRQGRLLQPDSVFAAEIAATYEGLGQPDRARITLLEGVIADPAQSGFAAKAMELYRRADPATCAVVPVGGLNLACPAVVRDLCIAGANLVDLYVQAGKPDEANEVRSNTLNALSCASSQR